MSLTLVIMINDCLYTNFEKIWCCLDLFIFRPCHVKQQLFKRSMKHVMNCTCQEQRSVHIHIHRILFFYMGITTLYLMIKYRLHLGLPVVLFIFIYICHWGYFNWQYTTFWLNLYSAWDYIYRDFIRNCIQLWPIYENVQ